MSVGPVGKGHFPSPLQILAVAFYLAKAVKIQRKKDPWITLRPKQGRVW